MSAEDNAVHRVSAGFAMRVRNGSDAILHRRPGSCATSEGRMSERSCASGLNEVCANGGHQRPGEREERAKNSGAVHGMCTTEKYADCVKSKTRKP